MSHGYASQWRAWASSRFMTTKGEKTPREGPRLRAPRVPQQSAAGDSLMDTSLVACERCRSLCSDVRRENPRPVALARYRRRRRP